MGVAEDLVSQQGILASLPSAYFKIRQSLADPDVSVESLNSLIVTDPSLTAAILKVANSAFYGFPRRIETVSRAINLIGLDQLSNIVLASFFVKTFQGIQPQKMDMAKFWRGSLRRALLFRSIARHIANQNEERSFIVGLLSNMGHLILYQTQPDLQAIILDSAEASLASIAAKQDELFGCNFTDVGAAAIRAWQLPEAMALIVQHQLFPGKNIENTEDTARLTIAITLAEELEANMPITAACKLISEDAATLGKVDLTLLQMFADECESQLESVSQALGIPTSNS